MEELLNIFKLYAYLVSFKIVTNIESEQLGPLSRLTKTEKIQHFLSLLDSKEPKSHIMFIKALYRTKELDSHHTLLELLRNKGVIITLLQ